MAVALPELDRPLCVGVSAWIPIPIQVVGFREAVAVLRPQDAAVPNESRQTPRRVRTATEAEQEELIVRRVVLDHEVVRVANVA
jgi:hypothetical protein